ncbi:MAG: GNAT family N-acetyltransferase [Chloroflexota bacterium]
MSAMDLPDTLVTTYLELRSRDAFHPAFVEPGQQDIVFQGLCEPDLAFYRFLYREVGEVWRWRDRLLLDDETLRAEIASPNVRIDVLYVRGAPAGYVECVNRAGDVEVAYMGLRAPYMGRGLGKHLLSQGVAKAWEAGATRVWLHTCNLDGPYALQNYQARGFIIYHVKREPMPDRYR